VSFILDALKKSENERQRQSGPGFAEIPVAQPRNRQPWWVFAVAALLFVNLLVLLIVLLRREPQPPAPATGAAVSAPAPVTAPPASTSGPAPTAAAPSLPVTAPAPQRSAPAPRPVAPAAEPATAPAARTLAEAAGIDDPYADVDPTLDYEALDAAASRVPAGPPIVQPLPGAARVPEERVETLPTVNDLALSGSASLPEMHLDIHVYAPVPADRFVFINMRKYVEGQKLQEGPVVERITRDGVVLNQQGLRFLLPSQ
jgi:general secretion pathway protein B